MRSAHSLPSCNHKRPSIKLTAASVKALALPDGKTDYTHFDADVPGFGLRAFGQIMGSYRRGIGNQLARISRRNRPAVAVDSPREVRALHSGLHQQNES